MKKKLISKYGYSYKGVSLDPVSKCVPDQSLSVEEILRRFTQGTLLSADIERSHPYGDDILPNEDDEHMDPLYDPETDLVDVYDDASKKEDLFLKVKKSRTKKPSATHSDGSGAASEAPLSAAVASNSPED